MPRSRSRRRSRRFGWLVFGIAIALALGMATYVYSEHRAHTRQRLAFDCATLNRLTASTLQERTALLVQASGPTTVFLGDSYTQGVGLSDIRDDYAYVTADALKWRAVLNAAGGTGYINGGPCQGQQLSARVPQVAATRPAIVVIQAGLNDYRFSQGRITDAAERLYAQLQKALPMTPLIVVGPHSVPKVPNVSPVVDALRTATSRAHVTYIDPASWPLSFEKDGIHLTVAGHRTYGMRLAQAIRGVTGR